MGQIHVARIALSLRCVKSPPTERDMLAREAVVFVELGIAQKPMHPTEEALVFIGCARDS
jgi:hypothetical protein